MKKPKTKKRLLNAVYLLLLITGITFSYIILSWPFLTNIGAPNNDRHFYTAKNKVWAHRGFSKKHPENTIAAFEAAINLGAKGIEVDIFYDFNLNVFTVSHDKPHISEIDKSLKLDTVFNQLGKKTNYWLDFKNLRFLSENELVAATEKLHEKISSYELTKHVVVESQNPQNLSVLASKGLNVSYWINLNSSSGRLRFWSDVLQTRKHISAYKFTALSMDYNNFEERYADLFPNVDFYLFTVNDIDTLDKLGENNRVKIILTDENFFEQTYP
ncbi:glycerophosphodiester phosphodiesterase [Kordiimonas aquimaris]|uniref:glycerophosphodiester phosphodiesterase n=1 Tax=Kordiimonas aquimaris TaxID=707591 RepID=UPI0021D06FFD|nr:glycerophosphodiester phosphodiesterase [Kordiimonas aquimaris]